MPQLRRRWKSHEGNRWRVAGLSIPWAVQEYSELPSVALVGSSPQVSLLLEAHSVLGLLCVGTSVYAACDEKVRVASHTRSPANSPGFHSAFERYGRFLSCCFQ